MQFYDIFFHSDIYQNISHNFLKGIVNRYWYAFMPRSLTLQKFETF